MKRDVKKIVDINLYVVNETVNIVINDDASSCNNVTAGPNND